MGYRIEYTDTQAVRRPLKWTLRQKLSLFSGALLGVALGLRVFFPGMLHALWQRLLPDTAAVDTLLQELGSGTRVLEAVAAFCQELLHGG